MIIPATSYILDNEKAWSLQEIHEQSPDSRGFHRYRIILVKRDGKLAEYREDMGEAKLYKGVRQSNVPSIWEHSVAELLDIADVLRNETFIDVKEWLRLETYKPA